ncbi:MAG: hypothetical protein DI598_08195 [Pseudopedobacter saltans]|uniref:Lipoprotein n=1 Tax=Pseudopedobacter saltans TaxID=151895 RepID=A0A2W5F1Q8_9SPHI|nr:MAG: hypothetical protein DI598_08195 [Pseudopedobacter saltans]
MRKYYSVLLIVIVFVLFGCSGSDVYRGNWKALTLNGEKAELTFEPKKLTIRDSANTRTIEYTQNSVEIKNAVKSYGINLKDSRRYKLYFPNAKDLNVGVITDENGNIIYTIGRKDFVSFEDINKL